MKATDKDKSIQTTPKGAWEGGIVNERKDTSKAKHLNEITTDAQGNGYPVSKKRDD